MFYIHFRECGQSMGKGGGIQGHEAVLWDLLKEPSVFVSALDGGGGCEI